MTTRIMTYGSGEKNNCSSKEKRLVSRVKELLESRRLLDVKT